MSASSRSETLPRGVGVALVTIFGEDGLVDIAATARKAQRCVSRGVTSVLVAGTTGEPWRLDAADRIAIATAVKEAIHGVPILVGTGDVHAERALEITKEVARAHVADALLVLSPTDMPTPQFYGAVRRAVPEGVVFAYNLPALSPPGIAPVEVPSLEVDAIKDSSGSADGFAEMVDSGVEVYVGSPNLLALAGRCGARGALLAVANVAEETCLAAWNGDAVAQRRLFRIHRDSLVDFPNRLKGDELPSARGR